MHNGISPDTTELPGPNTAVKRERVVISAHNATMRTVFRLVALTAPFWAVYIPGIFFGVLGFYLVPIFFDPNERIFWMLFSFSAGLTLTCMLSVNTLVLSEQRIVFPPLRAATLPISRVRKVEWYWDSHEQEAYMRFSFELGEKPIDIHYLRLTPKKIARMRDALKEWAPACEFSVEPDDLEDLIAFRERFLKPRQWSLIDTTRTETKNCISIPYFPHEQLRKFYEGVGANERYFWWCWTTVVLVPVIGRLPDIIWGLFAGFTGLEKYMNAPDELKALDHFRDQVWDVGVNGLTHAGQAYYDMSTHPFGTCILLGMACVAFTALSMFVLQPNQLTLTKSGIEIAFSWQNIVLFKTLYEWEKILEVQLDQFGDEVNPEKWRMQVKMSDGRTANLKVEAIKGIEARETLLKTITQLAPQAKQDPALIRALSAPQKESYTELWLQSLAAPPKRNRLTPLGPMQKIRDGRYCVEKQLAIGGQGTAYIAEDMKFKKGVLEESTNVERVVLKEFVLPVYTNKTIRKQALEKFENEARILGSLDHPQIVKLKDYFLEDHRAYLVLEHLDGLSLRRTVQKEGPMDAKRIFKLALSMCDVLEYLHNQSPPIVHRDFTPENLILKADGQLVLIDFNVAQQRQWTATGTVVGKHAYLPPEQFRGMATSQSDLYAMGATLYFLSTGKDPEPLTCSQPSQANGSVSLDKLTAMLTAIELNERAQNIEEVRRMIRSEMAALRETENTIRETISTIVAAIPSEHQFAESDSDSLVVRTSDATEQVSVPATNSRE